MRAEVRTYAERLAAYISDPSTVRARIRDEFGRNTALPTCEQVLKMRADRLKKLVKPAGYCKRSYWPCQHERIEDNILIDIAGLDRCKTCHEIRLIAQAKRDGALARRRRISLERAAAISKQMLRARADLDRAREGEGLAKLDAIELTGNSGRTRLLSDTRRAVAEVFGLTEADLLGDSRLPRCIRARSVAVMLFKDTGMSFSQIARALHYDCHSSVLHLYRTFDDRAARHPFMRRALEALL